MGIDYTIGSKVQSVSIEGVPSFFDPSPAKIDPFDPAPLLSGFACYEVHIQQIENQAAEHAVTDQDTSAQAVEMSGQARKLSNAIEKQRKETLKPFAAVIDAINSTVKPFTLRLTDLVKLLERKNTVWMIEEDRKRREAEAKARAEAEAKAKAMQVPVEQIPVEPVVVAPVYIPPAVTEIKNESGSQKIEYETIWDIADIRALPDECLQARAEQIKAAVAPWINARVKAGITNDSGIVYRQEPKLKTRVR